jgi:histone H3/H4
MAKKRAPRKESFSVASKIKEYVRSKGYCAGSDLPDAVSTKVVELLDAAIERTESNGRKTVRSGDL